MVGLTLVLWGAAGFMSSLAVKNFAEADKIKKSVKANERADFDTDPSDPTEETVLDESEEETSDFDTDPTDPTEETILDKKKNQGWTMTEVKDLGEEFQKAFEQQLSDLLEQSEDVAIEKYVLEQEAIERQNAELRKNEVAEWRKSHKPRKKRKKKESAEKAEDDAGKTEVIDLTKDAVWPNGIRYHAPKERKCM